MPQSAPGAIAPTAEPPDDMAEFRRELRAFIAAQLPGGLRDKVRRGVQPTRDEVNTWERRLAARGWLVPHWPEAWGGQAMPPDQRMLMDEEFALHDCPEANVMGVDMIGPMLMRFGDAAQQQRYLPRIAQGLDQWCQGYSEPNAGSDLASLQTRARRDGDHYVVNGSKIWTSGAHQADRMFALVRTGQGDQAKPQEGISFVLIDMRAPGVKVQPIACIHGYHLFNQVFLDDVRVPVHDRVGEENMGWTIAKSVLESERLKLSRVPENHRRMAKVKQLASVMTERGVPIAEREWFQLRLSALEVRLMALEASVARFRRQAALGSRLGPETGRLKLRGSQLIQDFENLAVDVAGPASRPYDPQAHHGQSDDPITPWHCATTSARRFVSRGYTIAGGSSEVQHIQLAKQVLGL